MSGQDIEIYTVGFTKKGAERFFGLLEEEGIDELVDVRINNRSQLSGFAKRDDLKFFLDELLGVGYEHKTELAPTEDLLDDWRKDRISWQKYEKRFMNLMQERNIEEALHEGYFESDRVLLCSEHEPEKCHRRLVVEYLDKHWEDVEGIHLK